MNKRKELMRDILKSFFIYFALFSDMSLIYPNRFAQPAGSGTTVRIVTFFQRLDALLGDYSLLKDCCLISIFLLLFLLRRYTGLLTRTDDRFLNVPAGLFTVLLLFAQSFHATNSAAYLFGDGFVFVISLLRGVGFYFLIQLLLILCFQGLTRWACSAPHTFRHKVTYGKLLLILIVAWLPQLLIIYPGGYCNDVQDQLMQFFGYVPMSNPHPPLFTMIIGACVWVGNLLSRPNLGLFLYILLQYLFMAAGLAYCLNYFHKKLQNKWFLLFGIGFFALLPNFSHYASVVIKNAPYAVCLLWMSICALEIIDGSIKAAVIYSAFALLGSLICHNGIYVAIPMSLVLVFHIIRKGFAPRQKLLLICASLYCILLYYSITGLLYPAMGIQKGKDHLLYTNQLQHTCRLFLAHPEEFTSDDMETLSKVIDTSQIETKYDPVTSDGIKPIVNLEASPEAVAAYRKLWFKQLKSHPLTVLEASFNVSYGFWAPVARNEENDFSIYYYESAYPEINFHVPEKLHGLRSIYEELLENYVSLPMIRLLQNPGLYFWIFLFVLAIILKNKIRQYLICLIPEMMTTLFYVGIPAYFHHPRYAFPLIYSTVMYLGLVLLALRDNQTSQRKTFEQKY